MGKVQDQKTGSEESTRFLEILWENTKERENLSTTNENEGALKSNLAQSYGPNIIADRRFSEESVETFSATSEQAKVRIDEVFSFIAPYTALKENKVSEQSMLGRLLVQQANAIFHTAFLNLQARYGYTEVFADVIASTENEKLDDVTFMMVKEVQRLQGLDAKNPLRKSA